MSCEIKARLTTFVDDTSSGLDITCNAKNLDVALEDVFSACRMEICKRADAADMVPYRLLFEASCEAIDATGNVIKDRTPRGLFELMSKEAKEELSPKKKRRSNNGNS